jgi:hypothetical protein
MKDKYQHLERWDTEEVQYLKELETLTVMPKIDGTNGAVHFEKDEIAIWSRHRELSVDDDNEGFCKFVLEHREEFEVIKDYILRTFENVTKISLFGEFTKKGTFTVSKKYFHKFCLFDILISYDNKVEYFDPNSFDFLRTENIIVVPSIKVSVNEVEKLTETHKEFSKFLLDENYPHGEGFVIKDYTNHKNSYNRTIWAKILFQKIRNEEKTKKNLYEEILENWFNNEFLDKEFIKYMDNFKEPLNKNKFVNVVVREFFNEELSNIIYKYKFPLIDTLKLKNLLNKKASDYLK